ncbi:MAG: hypothetical protein LBC76_04355 [Treponema sp.]|jgi:hypothetical protein|nr:hypothetical protein [Treponema sp.]
MKKLFSCLGWICLVLLMSSLFSCESMGDILLGVSQGLSDGLNSSYSGSSSSSSYSSRSSEKEYLVTVTGYNSKSQLMQGQWYIYASSESVAREEGRRRFLSELPEATHVNALAILVP